MHNELTYEAHPKDANLHILIDVVTNVVRQSYQNLQRIAAHEHTCADSLCLQILHSVMPIVGAQQIHMTMHRLKTLL